MYVCMYDVYGHFYNLGTFYVLAVTLVVGTKQQRCRYNNLYTRFLIHPPINYIIVACTCTSGILSITDMLSSIVAAYWVSLRIF